MMQGDIFRFINQANETTLQKIIQRLEFRDRDATFTQWRNDYLNLLDFSTATRILDVGCGTGVVTRALARRNDFSGTTVGVDHSPALIEAAQAFAAEVGLDHRVEFQTGDIHALEYDNDSFDIVFAHTVLSHVTDPLVALKEMARVTKAKGKIVIFDGDYASLTFAYPPDGGLAQAMEAAILKTIVNNPRVMRDIPFMFRNIGLELIHTASQILAEVSAGSFWASAAEAYGPLVAQAGLLPEDQVDAWLVWQRQAISEGVFFASCNYYTYICSTALT
jgi:ubiquinone/menaquinone biosynthesis C-methylase UbiE